MNTTQTIIDQVFSLIVEARSHGFHDAIDGGNRQRFVADDMLAEYRLGFENGERERVWLTDSGYQA